MAIRLADGSIRLNDGRILYANSLILGQDLAEVIPLFSPPPVWPFVGGGGGGAGPQGPAGPAGSGGGGAGFQGAQGDSGPQGFQGTNPGPQGNQGNQGDAGPQGNQGLAGTGTQGNQGNVGPQGNQGAVGSGTQGNQGVSGPQGNQGAAGTAGAAGAQGAQGFQGQLNPDIFAPTRVVDAGGSGTDLTIASALAALPAEGGSIYIKQGTYAIGATLTIPAGKPVLIKGSGNATVIDLGSNAIPAFTVPTGAATNTPIILDSFKVMGDETAGQAVLEYADNNGLAEIFFENLTTTGVEITINSNSPSQGSTTPGQDDPRFHMLRCRIRPCTTDNSVILHNSSFGVPRCWMTEVEFIGDSLFAIPGGRTAPLFGRIADDTYFGDLYMVDCEMSVGTGEHDFAVLEVVNSTIWNNDNVNTIIDFFMFGSFSNLGNNGSIRGSNLRRIYFELEEDGITFTENYLENCPIGMFGQGNLVGDNTFQQSGTWPVSHPFVIEVNNENTVIRHNKFEIPTAPTNVVVFNAPCTFTGNDLSDVNNPAGGTLLMQNGAIFVTNNRFEFASITGPSVNDGNGGNYYTDNEDLFTNKTGGGPIVNPIIGDGNRIEGTSGGGGNGAVGGTATNSIVVWYRNQNGLGQTKGYIQNTGANNITVRETFITDTLGTFTRTTVVLPGTKLVLDPFDFTGVVGLAPDNYQVVDYRVDVSGTTIAWYLFFPKPNGVNRGSN